MNWMAVEIRPPEIVVQSEYALRCIVDSRDIFRIFVDYIFCTSHAWLQGSLLVKPQLKNRDLRLK